MLLPRITVIPYGGPDFRVRFRCRAVVQVGQAARLVVGDGNSGTERSNCASLPLLAPAFLRLRLAFHRLWVTGIPASWRLLCDKCLA